jgi:hypothetical protein
MSGMIDNIIEMEPPTRIPTVIAVSGVCLIFLGLAGILSSTLSMIVLIGGLVSISMGLVLHNNLSPVHHRFEPGTRSAEHQYGPFMIRAESTIEVDTEGMSKEYARPKTRTIKCEAITEDGETLVSESDTEIVGDTPLTLLPGITIRRGDSSHAQSTENHVQEVSSQVKEDAVTQIANNGNDPDLKAALESELGEEWYGEKNDESAEEVSVADA